jgi:hypothetical protein
LKQRTFRLTKEETALGIDSVLEQQISAAADGSDAVGVWGELRAASSPDDVKKLVHGVLARVEKGTGLRADDLQVYDNLNAFSLNGHPELIRALADQPEVISLKSTAKGPFSFDSVETTKAEAETVRRHVLHRDGIGKRN